MTGQARDRTHLSFIVIQCGKGGKSRYLLQCNKHLKGENFLGGRVDDGESPQQATLRELQEEIGNKELSERWGIKIDGEVPEPEWQAIESCIQPLGDPMKDYAFRLPFFSLRAEREGRPAERLADLHFFHLQLDAERHPGLISRLDALADAEIPNEEKCEGFAGKILCRWLSVDELIRLGWENPVNPFIRFILKQEIIPAGLKDRKSIPYRFDAPAFEAALQYRLEALLRPLLDLKGEHALDVHVIPPVAGDVSQCLRMNLALEATIEIRWSGSSDVISMKLPYPWEGVFILPGREKAARWIWHPWLVDQPGVHVLRHPEKKEKTASDPDDERSLFMRLSVPGGHYVENRIDPDKSGNRKKITVKPSGKQRLEKFVFSPDMMDTAGWQVFRGSQLISLARKWVEEKYMADNIESIALDGQDMGYQRLYTYSASLLDRLLDTILRQILNAGEAPDRKQVRQLLLEKKDCSPAMEYLQAMVWQGLYRARQELEAVAICPERWRKRGRLHYFDPLNGLDAIRKLTAVNRYAGGSEQLAHYPAAFRQNHKSFRGVFCPVDTPESKMVGITLHLARGVRTNTEGFLFPATEKAPDRDLGWASSMVPFYHHNDGARNMMGGKNLCQAVPLEDATAPVVATGHELLIRPLLEPLSDSGILKADAASICDGRDMLIAYMPFNGLNFEDAIVANHDISDKGLLDWGSRETFQSYIRPGWEPCEPDASALDTMERAFHRSGLLFDANGRRHCEALVGSGAHLAWFKNVGNGQIAPVCFEGEAGKLTGIDYKEPASPLLGGYLHYSVQRFLPFGLGDKLTGRHGNKGVISVLLAPEKMPRLPDDERLPESLRGRAVDLVLNPHGVISRMNLGQLIETHYGLLQLLDPAWPISPEVGRAFSSINHLDALTDAFKRLSEQFPVDACGRMFLTLPDGSQTKAPVVVGTQRIFRLKHAPVLKAQARRGGPGFRYNAITGQPVGGRRRGGGQRLGEMEIWALAAHQADQLLSGVLGEKSNPELIQSGPGQSFAAIREHLYAVGIDLCDDAGKFRLGWLDTDTIHGICSGREVKSNATWQRTVTAHFSCPKCGWAIFGGKPAQGTGDPQRGSQKLTISDIFAHFDYEIVGLDPNAHPDGFHILQPSTGSVNARACIVVIKNNHRKTVLFEVARTKTQIKLKFQFNRGKEFAAYIQWRHDSFDFLSILPDMEISCSREHFTTCLEPGDALASWMPVPGGLYDPELFGDLDLSNPELRRAYINLPQPIPYPAKLIPKPLDRPVIDGSKIPPTKAVLVMPLRYRMGNGLLGSTDKLTLSYGELVRFSAKGHELLQQIDAEANEESRKTLEGELGKNKRAIQTTVRKIFLAICHRLVSKFGLIRRHGLGRRVDHSARLVIVPDPGLAWNMCGLPVITLMVLLGSRIAEWKLLANYEHSEVSEQLTDARMGALKASSDANVDREALRNDIQDWVASPPFWEGTHWLKDELSDTHLDVAREIIEGYLEAHPDIRVLLNRGPSLHRYNIMAFRPRPLPAGDGLVLKINPLVCKGFAADFDGDEMAIHMPLTDKEHVEAAKLEPAAPANLVSLANRQPLAHFDQDFVLGHFLIGMDKKQREKLRELFADHSCNKCRKILSKRRSWDKSHGELLLAHLCVCHPGEAEELVPAWMRLCFDVATKAGVSFGLLDLAACRPEQPKIDAILAALDKGKDKPDGEGLEEMNKQLEVVTGDHMKGIVENNQGVPGPGFGAAAMAFSGARGKKQVRQLVSARGLLSPGDTGFDVSAKDFFFSQSLLNGLDAKSAFFAAMNTRSSMVDKKLGTPQAGFLTRRLVLRLWPWHVRSGDCGRSVKRRTLSGCKWVKERKFCTACYGEVAGTVPSEGFPAGLIAAQSFGERGTQLSMQSFHTGTRAISLKSVEDMLKVDCGTAKKRDALFRALSEIPAYKKLDRRHLQLICLEFSRHGSLRDQPGEEASLFSMLAGSYQWQSILKAIEAKTSEDVNASPFGRLMLSRSPVGFWKGE